MLSSWYHACQYLHAIVEVLSLSEAEQNNWITEMKTLLWDGEVENIIQECRTRLDRVGYPAERLI